VTVIALLWTILFHAPTCKWLSQKLVFLSAE